MKTVQTKAALIVLVLTLVLIACRKDQVIDDPQNPLPVVIPNPNLAGDFYGDFKNSYNNTHTRVFSRDTSDGVIECRLNEDKLHIMGKIIKVDSSNQTVFSYREVVDTAVIRSIDVHYTSNYDSVYIRNVYTPLYYNGISYATTYIYDTITYVGSRGTGIAQPSSGRLYTLVVEKKLRIQNVGGPPGNYITVVDSHYTKDIAVDFRFGLFELDSVEFSVGRNSFRSYYDREVEEGYNRLTTNVYWTNDSFYLRYNDRYHKFGSNYPADTTYYVYKGRAR